MKKYITCTIEALNTATEKAIIISLDIHELPSAIILLSAFMHEKLNKVPLKNVIDNSRVLLTQIARSSGEKKYQLQLSDMTISLTEVWLEAVFAMLLEIQLNGWYQGAHIDQEFCCSNGHIDLCLSVNPPVFGN